MKKFGLIALVALKVSFLIYKAYAPREVVGVSFESLDIPAYNVSYEPVVDLNIDIPEVPELQPMDTPTETSGTEATGTEPRESHQNRVGVSVNRLRQLKLTTVPFGSEASIGI